QPAAPAALAGRCCAGLLHEVEDPGWNRFRTKRAAPAEDPCQIRRPLVAPTYIDPCVRGRRGRCMAITQLLQRLAKAQQGLACIAGHYVCNCWTKSRVAFKPSGVW